MSEISLSKMGADSTKLKKLFFYSKCLCIVGFSLTLTAIGSYFFADYMLKDQLYKNILIENNSKAYQFWKEPPAKIVRKYYLFDLVNPIEVEQGTAKPQVVQRGPYAFSEKWEKRNVQFYGLDYFSFKPVVTLHFEPSLSTGSLNDPITFLNIPAVGMIETLMHGKSNILTIAAANALFKVLNTKLFVTKTAGELISGYEDPLMEMASILLPNLIKEKKFSLINGKNGTEWQNYTLKTGKDDIQSVAKIKLWDGLDKLPYWDSNTANMINGSDGTFYPPFRTRTQNLYAYSPDMCRSYNLIYLRDNVVKGIKTYDFHLDKLAFYNTTLNPNNHGFCGRDDKCLGNGVQNISVCYGGVSGFISQPHFLNADAKFTEQVKGLKPDENLHDFILSFEPTSGVPITGNIRLQISFYMFHNKDIDLVKNVESNLLPVVWFDEQLDLYDDTREQLGQVAMIAQLCFIVPLVLLCFGAFWVLFSVSLFLVFKHKKKYMIETKRSDYESKEETSDEPTEATRLLSDGQEKVIN